MTTLTDEKVVASKPKVWFSADFHWDDERLHLFHCPFKTAFEFAETIVRNWNAVVGEKDEVYILGDVAVKKSWLHYMSQLNGTKHLRGN